MRSCEKCGESFVGKVALQNHKRKHNNAVAKMKAMMKCEICPYETSNLANMRRHTKSVHSKKPQKIKKVDRMWGVWKDFWTQRPLG